MSDTQVISGIYVGMELINEEEDQAALVVETEEFGTMRFFGDIKTIKRFNIRLKKGGRIIIGVIEDSLFGWGISEKETDWQPMRKITYTPKGSNVKITRTVIFPDEE